MITEEEIEENLVTDIKDLMRFEPGVSVRNSPARFNAQNGTGRDGNSGFNIRGLEGNRVLQLIDGVRVPDGFDFGPVVFGRGDYVDLDLLSSVEIVRGPASALYGSDGLAGVVCFITKRSGRFLGQRRKLRRARPRAHIRAPTTAGPKDVIRRRPLGRIGRRMVRLHAPRRPRAGKPRRCRRRRRRRAPSRTRRRSKATRRWRAWCSSRMTRNRFRLTRITATVEMITEVLTARAPASFPFPAVFDFDARR